jgi:hypothetical protein
MTTRSRKFVGIAVAALLLGTGVLWFNVFRDRHKLPVEQPKTTAQLLVGSWKLIERPEDRNSREPPSVEIIRHFAKDGTCELRVWDVVRGTKVTPGRYRLEGNVIEFVNPTSANLSPSRYEIWERVNTIESLTDEELVILSVTKKRWSPEMAQELADVREVPVAQVLAEVREDRSRSVYLRVKDE